MKKHREGFSLDILEGHYDLLTFTEKSRFRRNQIGLMDIHPGEEVHVLHFFHHMRRNSV